MSIALWTIRILRRLPHTARFDAHLTDCAAHAVLYAPFDKRLPALRLSHIFRRVALPSVIPHFEDKGIYLVSLREGPHEARVLALVAKQADDAACWSLAETATEAYLQRQLRLLHAAIEGTDFFGITNEVKPPGGAA